MSAENSQDRVGSFGKGVLPCGHNPVNIDGVHYPNSTREFAVDGGTALPAGTVVFGLGDGGMWDIVGNCG